MNVSTPHLNKYGLEIRTTHEKGRGIYATCIIPAKTVIEISPVLFFSYDEYQRHGRHTVLDHYTFVWGDGRMALPLGLGSLFNHSDAPNVTYTKNKESDCIEYATTREISAEEELCIFYGHNLWFVDHDAKAQEGCREETDEWAGLNMEDVY